MISRRKFLGGCAAVGGVAATAGVVGSGLLTSKPEAGLPFEPGSGEAQQASQTAPEAIGRQLPGAVDDRVLVIVDLQGGNDGLDTLIPAADGRYHDLRPRLAVPQDEVLWLDDDVGLNPSLTRLHERGLITVEGVGPINGDLSHFAMAQRWQQGDVDGSSYHRTGFLGRLADAMDDGSAVVGAALGAPSPYLLSRQAGTMALAGLDDLWFLEPSDWGEVEQYRRGLMALNDSPVEGLDLRKNVADGYGRLSELATKLSSVDRDDTELDWEDPMVAEGGNLGQMLYVAGNLIAADTGVRVLYTSFGDFDTHSGHGWRHRQNLGELDAAVDGFLRRAEEDGYGDRVVVATVSEFGRRVPENGDGLDHGSASTMLVAGAGIDGHQQLGERPPLDDLDEDDNLKVTIGFDRYMASLAQEWLGVEAASVLAESPEPLGLF